MAETATPPSWSTTTLKERPEKKTSFVRAKEAAKNLLEFAESKLPTAIRKYVNVTPWEEPTFVRYEDCKKESNQGTYCKAENGKIIESGDQMINFKRLTPRTGNTTLNYESRKKRYHRSKNYNSKTKKITYFRKNGSIDEEIPVDPTSLVFYTAKGPRLTATRRLYKQNALKLNAVQKNFKNAIQNPEFNFEGYQQRLNDKDPQVRDAAVKELRLLQQMFKDARVLTREQLKTKYERSEQLKNLSVFLAIGLGLGIGTTSNAALAIGKISTATSMFSFAKHKLLRNTSKVATPLLGVIEKAILAGLIGTILGSATGGIGIAVTAVVVSSVAVGAAVYSKKVEEERLTTEMDGDKISKIIDEMIHNKGKIFYEQNPMFAKAHAVKEKLEKAIQNKKNINTFINTELPEANRKNARIMYNNMKTMPPVQNTKTPNHQGNLESK